MYIRKIISNATNKYRDLAFKSSAYNYPGSKNTSF